MPQQGRSPSKLTDKVEHNKQFKLLFTQENTDRGRSSPTKLKGHIFIIKQKKTLSVVILFVSAFRS